MARIEQKFVLNALQTDYVRERLRFLTRESAGSAPSGYDVFSLYFDTFDLQAARHKLDGEARRVKLRLRAYGRGLETNALVYLEAKSKDHDDQQKLRLPMAFRTSLLDPASWFYLRHQEMTRVLAEVPVHQLVPTCGVYFFREPFGDDAGTNLLRLTIDSQLTALYPDELCASDRLMMGRNFTGHHAVLEIKTPDTEIPASLRQLLREVGAEKVRYSKYVEALQFLRWERFAGGYEYECV